MGDRTKKLAASFGQMRQTAKTVPEAPPTLPDNSSTNPLSANPSDVKDVPQGSSVTPKPAFVSPRRVVVSTGARQSGAVGSPAVTDSSPGRAKPTSRGSPPKRKVKRPCSRDRLSDDTLDDDDVSLELFAKAPAVALEAGAPRESEGTGVRRRTTTKARSSSGDDTLEPERGVNASGATAGGRVRSLSPDGRACCSPARGSGSNYL